METLEIPRNGHTRDATVKHMIKPSIIFALSPILIIRNTIFLPCVLGALLNYGKANNRYNTSNSKRSFSLARIFRKRLGLSNLVRSIWWWPLVAMIWTSISIWSLESLTRVLKALPSSTSSHSWVTKMLWDISLIHLKWQMKSLIWLVAARIVTLDSGRYSHYLT